MDNTPEDGQKDEKKSCCVSKCGMDFDGLVWWATLIIAVLAVPAISAVVTMMLPLGDMGRIIAFVVGCWVCTWLGMWLMHKADIKDFSKSKDENE